MADEQFQNQNPIQSPPGSPVYMSQVVPAEPEKKSFLKSSPGKITLLTIIILGLGAVFMYSSGSIGLKGDFTQTETQGEGQPPQDQQQPAAPPKTPIWRNPKSDTKILSTDLTNYTFDWVESDATSYEWKIIFKSDASITSSPDTFENKENKILRILAQSKEPLTTVSFKLDPSQISQPDLQNGGTYFAGVRAKRTDAATNQATYSPYAITSFILESPNVPPNAPKWVTPDTTKEIAQEDLEKTEFAFTDGGDPDNGPAKKPNYQFAILKGELTDQKEIADAFSALDAEVAKKYEFAWLARWTDKKVFDDIQKLLNAESCTEDMGNSTFVYRCTKFKLPQEVVKQFKSGQKYTLIAQASDGKASSPYALATITIKKAADCPLNQYYITDSKNAGCKKVPNFVGAFSQAGFMCSLYKTLTANPDNSYRLSTETKTALQKNIDSDCSKKPDDKKICQAKMTYLPKDKTLCEPFKSIVDPNLSKDVCDQYAAEKENTSLSSDTKKQLETNLATTCKPKICPTGKYLNGASVPENCEAIPQINTIASSFDQSKACEAMKKIAATSDASALDTFKIDQATLDQIKTAAKSEICNPKPKEVLASAPPPSLSYGSPFPKDQKDQTTTQVSVCPVGKYLAGSLLPADCKIVPDLFTLSAAEIPVACTLYKKLTSGALDGKMDTATKDKVKKMADNVLCYEDLKSKTSTPTAQAQGAPPSLSMPKEQPKVVAQNQPPANPTTTSQVSSSTTPETITTTELMPEPLTYGQANVLEPRHPVAGNYVPRSTSNTGPELWVYAFGAIVGLAGSQTFKKKK